MINIIFFFVILLPLIRNKYFQNIFRSFFKQDLFYRTYAGKRKESEHHFAYYLIVFDKSHKRISAVGGMISVVAHNENMPFGNRDTVGRTVILHSFFQFTVYIRLRKLLSVNVYAPVFVIEIYRLPLLRYYAFYKR